MACNCLETSKENILAKLAEMHPERTINGADFEHRIWCFDDDMKSNPIILTHSFKYEYTFVKTNGTTSIQKNTSININPSYCGFCGKKFVED
mgnify:CR=1 FL=1